MKRLFHLVVTILLLLLATACQPTGSPRCDANPRALAVAEIERYVIDCTPGFTSSVVGWADHDRRTLWVWPEKILSDKALTFVLWHELGHVVWERMGYDKPQATEEWWADGYAYCRMTAAERAGVGFKNKPTNCERYLL